MKIALALGGGGLRGAAHVSVLRALEAASVPIHIVTGTSAGAIIGALYAAGKSPDEILHFLRRTNPRRWFAADSTGLGLFSTDGIRRVLRAEIGGDARIEELPRRFACVAVDLAGHCERVFDRGSLADAVCASAAFPGLYAPLQMDGHMYADGGILNPVPFDIARQMGADRVLAVDLGTLEEEFVPQIPLHRRRGEALGVTLLFHTISRQKAYRVVDRAIGIMGWQIRQHKMKQAPPDALICPRVQKIGLMDFQMMEDALRAGEIAAQEALPQIQALLKPERFGWLERLKRVKR